MNPLNWWRSIPLLLRMGLLLAVIYILLQFFTIPGGLRLIFVFFVALGIFLYIVLDDRRIQEIVSFFRDDTPRGRRLRWGTLIAVPIIVGAFTLRATLPSYPPPFQLFVLHPTPPEEVWQIQVPSWVLEWRQGDIDQGKVLYEANCAYCHGKDLDGQGERAAGFRYPRSPVSFRDPGTIATLTLPYVYWKVSQGGIHNQFNSAMPSWGKGVYAPDETLHGGDLTPDEIWRIIQYLYKATGREPAKF